MKKREIIYWVAITVLTLTCLELWKENRARGVVAVIETEKKDVAPTAKDSSEVGTVTMRAVVREEGVKKASGLMRTNTAALPPQMDLEKRGDEEETDSVTIERRGDTVSVEIPITQKVYRDSSYTAWVSGYRVQLDSISVRERTVYVAGKRGEKRAKVSVGLTGGVGIVGLRGEMGAGWFVGVGVTVPLWRK